MMAKDKVITKVLVVSDKTRDMMVDYFDEFKREKTPQYAILQADDGETVVTLYQSGKAVFQGRDADLAADFWIETEKINSGSAKVTSSDDKKKDDKKVERKIPLRITSIGSDEVGTGDYFGPVVVTASYVKKEDVDFLIELGVKDSKKMTDADIKRVVPLVIKRVKYNTFVLGNKQYNEMYDSMNLNKMKAVLHNKVLSGFIDKEKYPYDYMVVDQFENPKSYYNHLSDAKFKVYNITFLTKAEDQCLAVACSSIISRFIFLQEMDKLSKKYGIEIPKGANDIVNEVGKEIVKKYGKEELREIAKLNFKNTEKILN